MTRPRIRMDGRLGTLRWRTAEGRQRSTVDRLHRLPFMAAQQVVAGSGIDFEVRTVARRKRTKWHLLRMTFDEAVHLLESERTMRRQVERCMRIRGARVNRGLPIYMRKEYDE